jgi:hypothetical protein
MLEVSYINFSSVGMKSQEKDKLVGDESLMLAVVPKGGECCVRCFGNKKTAVANSDCRLLKVGVKN